MSQRCVHQRRIFRILKIDETATGSRFFEIFRARAGDGAEIGEHRLPLFVGAIPFQIFNVNGFDCWASNRSFFVI